MGAATAVCQQPITVNSEPRQDGPSESAPASVSAPVRTRSNLAFLTCGALRATTDVVPDVPNFNGQWVCYRFDGDMDGYLYGMGASRMARMSAYFRAYDVDKLVRIFRQKGNDLDIEVRGKRKFTQLLSVGAGMQATEDEDGVILVTPSWDGRALRMEVTDQDGSRPRTIRQFLDQADLVVEATLQMGLKVSWRYRSEGRQANKVPPVMDPPAPPPAALIKGGRPDFSGSWLSQSVEGDVDGFYADLGVGKAGRTAILAMNSGVGMIEKVIQQNADVFSITDAWPTGPVTQKFRVGAGEQVSLGTQGREIYLTPTWEHNHVLHVITQPMDRSNTPHGPTRYYYEGQTLVVRFESQTGRWVKYMHRRSKTS